MGGWALWMVDKYICTKAVNVLWVDSWPRPKSNGRVKKYLGRRMPSSQDSLHRSPKWVRNSGQVPSLTVSLHRSLAIGRWKKVVKSIVNIGLSQLSIIFNSSNLGNSGSFDNGFLKATLFDQSKKWGVCRGFLQQKVDYLN